MPLKSFKPRSQGMRFRVAPTFEEITEKRPVKSLTEAVRKTAGRNNQGRITTRHHGGGAKQRYRIVDFKRTKFDVEAEVKAIAYDPMRSAYLAQIDYADGEKSYILCPEGLKVGMKVMNGPKAEATVGNCLPLAQIPLGMTVHAIELVPGQGAKVARGAGCGCQIMARDGARVTLKMPSGEVRIFDHLQSRCHLEDNSHHRTHALYETPFLRTFSKAMSLTQNSFQLRTSGGKSSLVESSLYSRLCIPDE